MDNYFQIDLTSDEISNKDKEKLIDAIFIQKINIDSISKKIKTGKNKVSVFLKTKLGKRYEIIYYYRSKEEISEMFINEDFSSVNLNFSYIDNFTAENLPSRNKHDLNNMNANYCFWDGHIDFSNARFCGYTGFSKSIFCTDDLCFEEARFSEGFFDFRETIFVKNKINFRGAKFSDGNISFKNAQFGDCSVIFDYADFGSEEFSFRETVFIKGEVKFEHAKFNNSDISFNFVDFGEANVVFHETIFSEGDMSFWGSKVIRIQFSYSKFKSYVNLCFKSISTLIMSNCKIEKIIFCDKHDNKYIKYNNISLEDTHVLGQIIFNWKENINWNKKNKLNAIENYAFISKSKDSAKLISQFALLKENFNKIGYYDDEDEAYKTYMRYKTKNLNICNIQSFYKKCFYNLFSIISDYGTNPYKLLFTTVIIIIFFGFLYPVNNYIQTISIFRNILRGQYFSTITFLTIGYREMQPSTDLTRILAGIEGFIGLFIMSFFTVVVARKIMR